MEEQTNSGVLRIRSEAENDLLSHVAQASSAYALAEMGEEINHLTPVYRLPDEILLVCFAKAIQAWKSSSRRRVDGGTPAITASHVSRHWRRLAINTPSLWTDVHITPNRLHDVGVIEDILRRSANMPIIMNFEHCVGVGAKPSLEPRGSSGDRHAYHDIADALRPSLHRISTLSMLDSGSAASSFLSHILTVSSPPSSEPFKALTTLTLTNPHRQDIGKPIAYPLFRQFLLASPNLKNLTLCGKVVDFARNNSATAISLPSLETMSIIAPPSAYRAPLNTITPLFAPTLHHLQFHKMVLLWTKDVVDALFKDDSSPKFLSARSLTLGSICFHGADRARLFVQAFPHVSHLAIDALTLGQIEPALCRAGEEDPEPAGAVWPNIRYLTLDYTSLTSTKCLSGVCYWLEARRNQGRMPLGIRVVCTAETRHCEGFVTHVEKLREYGEVELGHVVGDIALGTL
ncbi:hypothetical protein BV22DRAFT_1129329 [Leucogyrophana mollusca]|uniref:Uncharacterized protein n=1 Tax=Leucogyrophana mollusca TaxID=85980 RepID=A0ACB8BHS6_9AGAM|nr:hypothetical protein BV22DRAFT_1129329 [Leucogyrophana mollusca]